MRRLTFVPWAVLFVLVGCGSVHSKTVTVTNSAPTATSTAATTSSSTPRRSASAPSPVANLMDFQSPSGNIGCSVVATIARCDIRNRNWSPPARPADCPSQVDFGQGLEVYGNGPGRFVCAGDTAMNPTATVLHYGSSTVTGPFQCTSATNGMTCTDTNTGHGFFIAVQGYRTF